jgi:hypothetical protein
VASAGAPEEVQAKWSRLHPLLSALVELGDSTGRDVFFFDKHVDGHGAPLGVIDQSYCIPSLASPEAEMAELKFDSFGASSWAMFPEIEDTSRPLHATIEDSSDRVKLEARFREYLSDAFGFEREKFCDLKITPGSIKVSFLAKGWNKAWKTSAWLKKAPGGVGFCQAPRLQSSVVNSSSFCQATHRSMCPFLMIGEIREISMMASGP